MSIVKRKLMDSSRSPGFLWSHYGFQRRQSFAFFGFHDFDLFQSAFHAGYLVEANA